jgi:CheY-like chemotaxis protein
MDLGSMEHQIGYGVGVRCGRLILVVDDDDDIREAMRDALEDEGYNVETASDGAQALDRLRAMPNEPCLVLLDLMMPVMDGWTFLAERNQDPRLAGIPITIVSAARNVPPDVQCLAKPISQDRLLDEVHRHCES